MPHTLGTSVLESAPRSTLSTHRLPTDQQILLLKTTLPFCRGLVPAVIHCPVSQMLEGLADVIVYIDNILIWSSIAFEHQDPQRRVLEIAGAKDLTLK